MKANYLGIDFGTTKTLVSRYDTRRRTPQVVRLGNGRDYVPTSAYAGDGGEFLFGESADEAGSEKPSAYSRAFKMALGSNLSKLRYRENGKLVRCTASDLTRQFLEYILQECDAKSYPCERAVITRPVNFTPAQLAQLEEAARAAGLTEVEFITEPQAAGYAYCLERPDDEWQNALVVDWGGGTLDMALVSKNGDDVEIHRQYQDGMSRGGENFDDALLQYARLLCMNDATNKELWAQDEMTAGWLYRARKIMHQAKEDLSRKDVRTIRLSSSTGEVYSSMTLRRENFEQAILQDLEKAAQMAKSLIVSIKERELKPNALLLVGGSSRIPAVARILERETGLACRTWDMAGEAVSLGAAILAHRKWGMEQSSTQETIVKSDTNQKARQSTENTQTGSRYANAKEVAGDVPPQRRTSATRSSNDVQREGSSSVARTSRNVRSDAPPTSKPQRVAAKPSPESSSLPSKSLYRQGVELLYGIGCSMNKARAVELFRKGFAQGDMNAGYMLAACLGQGEGVARDYDEAFKVADQLSAAGFYPAYYCLAEAYGEGKGAELDMKKAEEMSRKLRDHCNMPIPPNVEPAVHYNALMASYMEEDDIDYRELERLARENYKVSDWPARHANLAICLLPHMGNSPSAVRELRQLLEQGCKESDPQSLILAGMLVSRDQPVWEKDIKIARQYLLKAASIINSPHIWGTMLNNVLDENDQKGINTAFGKIWDACHRGMSGLSRSNELNCEIRLAFPDTSEMWCVYKKDIAQSLVQQKRVDEIYTRCEPRIYILNKGSSALFGFEVRVCSPDVGLDRTVLALSVTIKPGESFELTDEITGSLTLGKKLYVRVSKGQNYSDMSLDFTNGVDVFRPSMVPLILHWKKGLWGGYILLLESLQGAGTLEGIEIHKASGAKATIPALAEGQTTEVGWMEFDDNASLAPGEVFFVLVPGFSPIEGTILEQVFDAKQFWYNVARRK